MGSYKESDKKKTALLNTDTQSTALHTDDAILRCLSPAGLIKCDEEAMKFVVFISVKEKHHKQSNMKPLGFMLANKPN